MTLPAPTTCRHAVAPSGYIQWHVWAESMAKTHRQERCPGCGLFAIWVPTAVEDAAPGQLPAPTPCVTCDGSGLMPLVLDVTLAGLLAGRDVKVLPPSPCIVCRCFCGQPAVAPGGMCEGHESLADVEDDVRARRAA